MRSKKHTNDASGEPNMITDTADASKPIFNVDLTELFS